MKLFLTTILFTGLAFAGIDGKWTVELKAAGKKQPATVTTMTLDLKSEGAALTGAVIASGDSCRWCRAFSSRPRSAPVKVMKIIRHM